MFCGKLMNKILRGIKTLSSTIAFSSLPKEKRQITFYSEGKNYWPHLQGLLEMTLEKTDKFICYVSSSLDDPGLQVKHPRLKTFFIGFGFVRDYFFQNLDTNIMVMTMPDLNKFNIKRSNYNVNYIYVQHSLVSLHMIYRHGAFDHYDTICASGPHHVAEIKSIELKYSLPKKKIIQLGYSRLDNLIKKANNNLKSKDLTKKKYKIFLIAPSWGPKGLIESGAGKNLIVQLFALGHKVILRPHPQTIKFAKDKVDEIINLYKNNPSFTFEDNNAGQESFYHSDIMVSDWSGAALEYAFALNKPIIFCDIPKKINNLNYHEIENVPIEISIREKIGTIWNEISPIEEAIKLCEQKSKNDFQKLLNQYVFNKGFSDEVFVKTLKTL